MSRIQRELAILGIGAILGFVVMPALTWLIGMIVFKTYAGGNTVFSLYGNFYKALAKGAPVFWIVAVGPYALILVARLLVAVFRGGSDEEAAEAPAPQPRRRAPQLADPNRGSPPEARRPAQSANRPSPDARRPAPQPNRAPPPAAPPPARKAPPKPGERRTPFIKSID